MNLDLIDAVTKLAIFILGFLSGKAFTMWEANRAAEAQLAAGRDAEPVKLRGFPVVVTVLIAAFLMLAGFGIQQTRYQANADDYDACVRTWGEDLVDSVSARSKVASKVTDAETARDNAVDNVILVVSRFSGKGATPAEEEQGRREFRAALADFTAAKAMLTDVKNEQENTKASNPYPKLSCR